MTMRLKWKQIDKFIYNYGERFLHMKIMTAIIILNSYDFEIASAAPSLRIISEIYEFILPNGVATNFL